MGKKGIQLKSFHTLSTVEAGCDEAGRGCLAGPVVAAAVILPASFQHEQLTDSKKLSDIQRRKLRVVIEEKALAWAVGIVSNEEIDEINILNASFLAMHRAIDKLKQTPEHILVDGNRFKPYKEIPHHCIIKGDGKYLSIAAASILAKTYRDDIMIKLHKKYPVYDWHRNMGYPTQKHRDMIKVHGITPHHRLSFNLIDRQQKIEFPE
jgi:ribonuclease HII